MKNLLVPALIALMAVTARADTLPTLQKIAESKKIVMGVREAGAPLSYTLGAGRFTGYHVELCERIIAGLQRELKLPALEIAYQPVTSTNRMPLVQNGTVDLECGTTTNNAARLKEVAFAFTTFVTEVRMAVPAASPVSSVAQLEGKKVVTTSGSTSVKTLRLHRKAAGVNFQELYGKDISDSFLMLESGRADVMVDDNNILAGNISMAKAPENFKIVGETLAVEPIAIMLRKDDPGFKKAVDAQLGAMMTSGEVERLYGKWFMAPIAPKNISLNLPMSEVLRKLIAEPNDNPAESYQSK